MQKRLTQDAAKKGYANGNSASLYDTFNSVFIDRLVDKKIKNCFDDTNKHIYLEFDQIPKYFGKKECCMKKEMTSQGDPIWILIPKLRISFNFWDKNTSFGDICWSFPTATRDKYGVLHNFYDEQ